MAHGLSEFINGWNQSMPMRVSEAEVKNPTECTFRRLLIVLLKHFNVDTTAYDNIDHENNQRSRAARIQLVLAVKHFLKIANPTGKQDFCYQDLMKPNPKKMINVLNYLLNYYSYVAHVHNETVGKLKGQLEERDQLRLTQNQLRKEIETSKIAAENNVKAIRDYEMKIPRYKAKNAELEDEEKSKKHHVARLKEAADRLEMKLLQDKSEVETLRDSIVSDQEINELLTTKRNLEQQKEEQDQVTAAARRKLKQNSRDIKDVNVSCLKMEEMLSTVNLDAGDMKTMVKTVRELQHEINTTKAGTFKEQQDVVSLQQAQEVKVKSIADTRRKRADAVKLIDAQKAEHKNQMKHGHNSLTKLSAKEAELGNTNQQLRLEQEQLFRIASNVIKHISNQIFEDDAQ